MQRLTVNIAFPVHFTQDVFAVENDTLCTTISRLEPDTRHRALFVVDQGVINEDPEVTGRIQRYVTGHQESLELLGEPLRVPGGEACKMGLDQVHRLIGRINDLGIDRQSFLVVVGGGAVLDMAGFAAAVAHRGIRLVRMPTTVLSQGDAGVGVKCGVNVLGKKNFIGVFAPPFGVINAREFIDLLPLRDKIAGVAEAIKVALIRDGDFYLFLQEHAPLIAQGQADVLEPLIRRSAELHLQHIRESGDPFELGSARPLDFGHWSAHKLELMTDARLRHGEAVSIGMALDVVYSMRSGHFDRESGDGVLSLLAAVGLPLWDDALLRRNHDGRLEVLHGLREFREHLGGRPHVTLLTKLGQRLEVNEIDEVLMSECIHELMQRHSQYSAPTLVGGRSRDADA